MSWYFLRLGLLAVRPQRSAVSHGRAYSKSLKTVRRNPTTVYNFNMFISIYPSFYLSIYLSIHLSIYLSVYLSSMYLCVLSLYNPYISPDTYVAPKTPLEAREGPFVKVPPRGPRIVVRLGKIKLSSTRSNRYRPQAGRCPVPGLVIPSFSFSKHVRVAVDSKKWNKDGGLCWCPSFCI